MALKRQTSGRQTSKLAVQILRQASLGFHEPTRRQRLDLSVAFAKRGMVLHRDAFDLVKCPPRLNLNVPEEIEGNLDDITVYEVKSSRLELRPDLRNYFFSLSTAELLSAQNLKNQYRFAFVNTITRRHVEMTLREVLSKARIVYPEWAIRI